MKNRPHFTIPFLCLMVFLVAAFVQGLTHWVPARPLVGFYDAKRPVKLKVDTWLDGSYQDYLTDYARVHTGFREFLIRNYNQCCYFCFNKITNDNVICGKNDELYMKMYLDDVTGKRVKEYFKTADSAKAVAREHVQETLRLIDTLQHHGTQFLFVFAPSKVLTYPENLPNAYRDSLEHCDFLLSQYYIEQFKAHGIDHIDFTHYFKTLRDTFPYPLYTRYGSHWSEATIPLVADTLLRKLEAMTPYRFPDIQVLDENYSTDYSEQDGELEALMNLYFPVKKPAVSRPLFTLTDTLGKDKPNLLIVGDSYSIQLVNSCFADAFNRWDFWQYNDNILSSREYLNWKKVPYYAKAYEMLEETDIVVAIVTSAYIYEYLWGFEQTAFQLFAKGSLSREETIQLKINEIKNNPQWYELIVKQASERNVSVEENLRNNALYVLDADKKKQEAYESQQP